MATKIITTIALISLALTALPKPACADGRCGECYNTGVPGKRATYQGVQYCNPC